MNIENPSTEEMQKFSLTAFKGIEVGLGRADKVVAIAAKLEEQYPMHLILVQSGGFLHGYDRTAHFLNTLKKYKIKLVGTSSDPHLRVGFPLGNHKRRLWSIVDEFKTPYVISLGTKESDRDVYVSPVGDESNSLLAAVSRGIVMQVIEDLQQHGEVNAAGAKKLLTDPDTAGFKLKSHAQELDQHLTMDLIAMPRDIRVTWGENVRVVMARIMHDIYAYGLSIDKACVLRLISADIDLLKHYLAQGKRLSKLKFSFEHRVSLAVELGRLLGGVMRASKVST